MNALVLFLAVVLGSAVETVVPSPSWLGRPDVPVLLAVTLYCALMHSGRRALAAAILAGIAQDAMGQVPLGYHAFAYVLVARAAGRFRGVVLARSWTTHVVFGAPAAAFVTLFCGLLLLAGGRLAAPVSWVLLKALGSLLAGALVTPLVFRALLRLEEKLGVVEPEDA